MYFEDTYGTTELNDRLFYYSDDLKALAETLNDIRINSLPRPDSQNIKEKIEHVDAQLRVVLMGIYTISDSLRKQSGVDNEPEG